MASFWGRLSMERAQQEALIKQTLCANLNTYIFCLIFAYAEGWAFSLAETMRQHGKSELLYFLSVTSSGVSLPRGSSDVELCHCPGSSTLALECHSWQIGTDNSCCSLCCSHRLLRKPFLVTFEPPSHPVGLGLSAAGPPAICVSLGLELRSIIWGGPCKSGSLCWKLFCVGKLSAVLVFDFLEII